MVIRRRREHNSRYHANDNNTSSSSTRIPRLPSLSYQPETSLLQMIRQRDWPKVQMRLENSDESTVLIYPKEETTALHTACLHRAPHDIILGLIQVDPMCLVTTDGEGWIPLHVHLLYSSGHTPTTLALIAAGGVEAAQYHLRFGGAALHLACRHGANAEVLRALVHLAPEQIGQPTPSGNYAAPLLLRRQQPPTTQSEKMERILVLVEAWANKKMVGLSDVVRFQVACSPAANIVQCFIDCFGRGPSTCNDGPLHVAAAAPFVPCDPLVSVLNAFPEDAGKRPFPLHVALRKRQPSMRDATLTQLKDAYPMALQERDTKTGLCPFQLAAAATSSSSCDSDMEKSQLNRIYCLLREAPHVISA